MNWEEREQKDSGVEEPSQREGEEETETTENVDKKILQGFPLPSFHKTPQS